MLSYHGFRNRRAISDKENVIRQARVPESEVILLDEVSQMGNRGHGEGNRFSESRTEPSGRGSLA